MFAFLVNSVILLTQTLQYKLTDFLLSADDAGETCWDTGTNFDAGRYSLFFLTSAASSSAKVEQFLNIDNPNIR